MSARNPPADPTTAAERARREHLHSPLGELAGARPPAPAWYHEAMAQAPECRMHEVDGTRIETLSWGERGRPGLLLLHGNRAHAGWWSFIAPFFASQFRVVAPSWPGLGGSDWREHYATEQMGLAAEAIGRLEGFDDADAKPVWVAHSFGGFPTLNFAARHGERLRAAVIVDIPLLSRAQREAKAAEHNAHPGRDRPPPASRVYPTVAEALARFRFEPLQPCENLFLVDHIARGSLRETDGGHTWRFDPMQWRRMSFGRPPDDLAAVRCPIALMRGERSTLVTPEVFAYQRSIAPAGTPAFEIPGAWHHVMMDQPLAFVAAVRSLLAAWPAPA